VWRRWTWPVVTVVSLLPLGAHASPTIAQPSNPQQITDGNAVPECAWPSVVALYSGDGTIERCSGFYIGGRVVLTAAHCVPRGFRVPPVTPTCQNDSDCPDEDPFGESLDLVCPAAGSDFCEDPDATKSNGIEAAQFGEVYLSPELDGHIRRSVDIEYCRRRTDDSDDDVAGTSNDIAYCILRATPNVQPVPLAMHCEAEQFLSENTQVTAVGFRAGRPGHRL
jgi:hypothetical protein